MLENVYLRIRRHKAILQMTVVNKRGIYDAEKKYRSSVMVPWISHRNSQRKKILRLFHFMCPLTVKRIKRKW